MGPLEVVSQLATGISVLAGVMLVKTAMDGKPMAGGGGGWPRCPKCNGTGRVACMCSRWSDGDVGCRTCADREGWRAAAAAARAPAGRCPSSSR
ncbi:unnamed protein product [Spirodela intermedia]|uniref:Uncharacterized protein n=1 Tax=Spirodela intermedia TaxID=51605 RepID=A0A7I8IS01_SPIIN|nr:unnamed protein product [Spirodela intermedia]CAA6659934.1 unnamed protein product [Spirodela intermedia]